MTTEIKSLNNDELIHLISDNTQNNNLLIIDIREPDEYRKEHIKGARNVPLSRFDSTDFSQDKDKIALFHCRLGSRTKSALHKFQAKGFNQMYCMQGGIEQWKACKLPVEQDVNAPMEIMRQVQIIAGLLVLIGVLLGFAFSPYFTLLSGFIGAGLLFAGLTGFCGMAKLLQFAPWNR